MGPETDGDPEIRLLAPSADPVEIAEESSLRPRHLDEFVGQAALKEHLTIMLEAARRRDEAVDHMLFAGPPGLGKTSLAGIVANEMGAGYRVTSGPALVRAGDLAALLTNLGEGDVLFVDEIHRFNRSQQDSFLPVVEDGSVTLIGATTENPSFELNAALLSRARVMVFRALDEPAIEKLLARAEEVEGKTLPLEEDARLALIGMADGDGRAALTLAEEIWRAAAEGEIFDRHKLIEVVQRRAPIYDKAREGHYNLISALHKCVRGSDPDAALYYLARMLDAGEDPLFLARRIVRMAVEDVGLADPQALVVANAAKDAYDFLGSPEGELALAQAVIYVASAPKSNAAYVAYKAARRLAREHGSLTPPKIILNAPTKLMQSEGYGEGYEYDHDSPDGFSGQNYWPESLGRQKLYAPVERGFERELGKRLDYWRKLRDDRGKS